MRKLRALDGMSIHTCRSITKSLPSYKIVKYQDVAAAMLYYPLCCYTVAVADVAFFSTQAVQFE